MNGPLSPRLPNYSARYRRDSGGWYVEIVEEPRVHSEGDSLPEARTMIRDALATWLDCEVEQLPPLRDLIELPDGADLGRVDDALSP